jgi:hypothetical protein
VIRVSVEIIAGDVGAGNFVDVVRVVILPCLEGSEPPDVLPCIHVPDMLDALDTLDCATEGVLVKHATTAPRIAKRWTAMGSSSRGRGAQGAARVVVEKQLGP